MMGRWCDSPIGLPVRRLHRGWDQVVLEIAAQHVAILVVRELLVQRRSKPLRQTTMYLPLDYHRIDDRAAVVHGHEAADMHLSRTTVDIENTDAAAKGVRQVGTSVVVHCLQSWLQVRRTVGIGGKCQFLDGLALVRRPFHKETSRLPFEVLFTDFQQVSGNLLRLVTHFASCQCGCATGHRRAAACICAKAVRSGIPIAMLTIDIIPSHTSFARDILRTDRLVSLALRLHTYAGHRFSGAIPPNLPTIQPFNATY